LDVVVRFKLDRLGRSLAHLAQIVAELTAHGVALICTTQGIDTTDSNPAGRLQLGVLMAVAEFEREIIRERVNAGIRAARQRGTTLGRPNTLEQHRVAVHALLATGKGIRATARELGLLFQQFDVRLQEDIDMAFQAAAKGRADAVLVLVSVVLNSYRKQVIELAVKNRLPAIYPILDFVEAGGLMSYGVSFIDLHRRAATYVDKILKGAKPGDLPVEQPTKFEFIVNLKAAKQIGLTIPPNVLVRADRVIK
jgi:hypothetical protein